MFALGPFEYFSLGLIFVAAIVVVRAIRAIHEN